MPRKYGDISQTTLATSDGASVPLLIRWGILLFYGAPMMQTIDESGLYHDFLIDIGLPLEEARIEFIKDLLRNEVPVRLTQTLHFGLYAYDASSVDFKKILKKTV